MASGIFEQYVKLVMMILKEYMPGFVTFSTQHSIVIIQKPTYGWKLTLTVNEMRLNLGQEIWR